MKQIFAVLGLIGLLTMSAAAQDETIPDEQALAIMLAQGEETITPGELLLNDTFDTADNFPEYENDDSNGTLDDGAFRMFSRGDFYSWQIGNVVYDDVIIQVDAHQNSDNDDNDYGLLCRGEVGSGTGYYFVISGDGFYSIRRLSDPDEGRTPLVDWTESEHINQGQADNQITAVCAGDYLALYVNGHLLVETRDPEFSSGFAGTTIAAYAENAETDVSFDNLVIWQADLENPVVRPETRLDPTDADALKTLLAQGSAAVVPGSILLNDTFDSSSSWTEYDDPDSTGTLDDGAYRMTITGDFYNWSLSDDSYSDTIIVVDTQQNSEVRSNDYGVACRSTSKFGAGYYFLIAGDGYYSILKLVEASTGREELVPWTASRYLNQGQQANQIVAVCAGDYLALYANGHLLAEVNDPEFSEGNIGMNVGAYDQEVLADISFDNLVIWGAE
jgi:hypothetical protein